MDGRVILKLCKPSKDNTQHLLFENCEVMYYSYSLHKGISRAGEVRGDTQAGNIRIALPGLPADELLGWVFDSTEKRNGEIGMDDMTEESLENMLLTVNVQRMIIGNVEYKNPWKK